MNRSKHVLPVRTVIIYILFACLWILLSDQALLIFTSNPARIATFQTLKGWLFVLVSAGLLYLVLQRQARSGDLAELALRESEERLRTVLQTIKDGYWLLDEEGRIVDVNESYCLMSGYTREELLGLGVGDLDALESPYEVEAHLNRIAEWGAERFETVHRRKDGSLVHVEMSTTYLSAPGARMVGFIRDISERRVAEAERQRLSAAIEQTAEVVVVTDTAGTILYVNPAFETVTGYDRAEVIGKTPRILKSGVHSDEFYAQLWQTILGRRTWRGRITNRSKDGRLFTEEAAISPIIDPSGEIVNFVAAKRDITNELNLEAQLLRAQKLESLGTLAAGIAHDFNNLLAIILGHSSLLAAQKEASDGITHRVEAITRAAQRGVTLVKQLLAFARTSDPVFEKVQLNTIVIEVERLLQETFPKYIEVSTELQDGLPLLTLDAGQIHQVMLNLCINARDAMQKGGSLLIGTRLVDRERTRQSHPSADELRYAEIVIEDTGTGMDEATRERIFEPFFTTKEVGKGTGLGLSVVYGIIENHRGFIDVESSQGEGTVFHIYLPVTEE